MVPGDGKLDSMAIDGAGNACVATVFRGGIALVSPNCDLLRQIDLPDPITTNLCFGGDGGCTAYVTMAATGQLVALEWPTGGLRVNFSA